MFFFFVSTNRLYNDRNVFRGDTALMACKNCHSHDMHGLCNYSGRRKFEVIFIESYREVLMRAQTQNANANPWSPLPENLTPHCRCEWGFSKKQPKISPVCVLLHTRHGDPARTKEPALPSMFLRSSSPLVLWESYKLLIEQSQSNVSFSG